MMKVNLFLTSLAREDFSLVQALSLAAFKDSETAETTRNASNFRAEDYIQF